MRDYICFWREKRVEVQAETSYDAQCAAAKILKVKKRYEITVFLADRPISTASLG